MSMVDIACQSVSYLQQIRNNISSRHDILYSGGNACIDGRERVRWYCFYRSRIICSCESSSNHA
jgi:hypothetical protein